MQPRREETLEGALADLAMLNAIMPLDPASLVQAEAKIRARFAQQASSEDATNGEAANRG